MTTTEPDTATLAAEIAGLRAELAELRDQLATEVRTQRLVVVDEAGAPVVEAHGGRLGSHIDVRYGTIDDLVAGRPYGHVQLSAGVGESAGEHSHATVCCSVGDDAYAELGVVRRETEHGYSDDGSVILWQHEERPEGDGQLITAALSPVEVGRDGLTERGNGNVVLAHSPMVRVPTVVRS